MSGALSDNTLRLYEAAQDAFLTWCSARGVAMPAPLDVVARYLLECYQRRGYSSARQHLSAIASMYRERGLSMDTKAAPIASALRAIRPPVK